MEELEINIDGAIYRVKRRRFKSGKLGFLLQSGGHVHGRMSWIQVIVRDNPELSPEQRVQKRARNKMRKLAKRARKRSSAR